MNLIFLISANRGCRDQPRPVLDSEKCPAIIQILIFGLTLISRIYVFLEPTAPGPNQGQFLTPNIIPDFLKNIFDSVYWNKSLSLQK